jgi:hypothetical protein
MIAIATLVPCLARADAWVAQPGDYYSEFRGSHWSSNQFFDENGKKQEYSPASVIEMRDLRSYNEIGWKKHGSIVISLPGRSLTLRSYPLGGTTTVTGLADLVLGYRIPLKTGPTALSVEADWKAPLGYEHTSVVSLGSGQQDVGGHLGFGTAFGSSAFFEATGGYLHRFEQPLDEIFFSADLGYWVGQSFLVEGRYDGFTSTGSAPSSSSGASEPKPSQHRIAPRLTYRLDDRLDVFAGAAYSVAGKSIADYDEYFVGVAFKKTRFNRLQGYLGGTRQP